MAPDGWTPRTGLPGEIRECHVALGRATMRRSSTKGNGGSARHGGRNSSSKPPRSVREEVHLVVLHRPGACLLSLLHPSRERMDDPSGVSRKPVRKDQQARIRTARGEGVMGSGQEVVPIAGDHDPPVMSRSTEVHWIVLRQGRMGTLRGSNVKSQAPSDLSAGVRNVSVDVEASAFQPSVLRVKGISSATRSGVQYASRARRSSISSG